MNKVVLYIKDADNIYQSVDLFKDETLSVTSKIQDIKDISKVFTDFSQSFTIPASRKNNKIFKHFYNYFISDGAFDSRKKVDAKIEINYIPFKDGKVFLDGVQMKNNKAHSYKLTFFGNTVNLPDILGDDKLDTLTYLDNFQYDYDNASTKSKFISGQNVTVNGVTKIAPVIVPLITHTKRLFFDSSSNNADTLSGNLNYQSGGGAHLRGVSFIDLKPAIRLIQIIEAIEDKYSDIEFTRDFFGSESFLGKSSDNNGLYMWLSREKGFIGSEGGIAESTIKNITYSSGVPISSFIYNTFVPFLSDSGQDLNSVLNIEKYYIRQGVYREFTVFPILNLSITTNSSLNYDVKLIDTLDDNKVLANFEGNQGGDSFEVSFYNKEARTYGLKWIVSSDAGWVGQVSQLKIEQEKRHIFDPAQTTTQIGIYSATLDNPVDTIKPTERIPEMKIIDFITSLFKMFNLTAYYIDDLSDANYGKIKVVTLNDYYSDNPKIFDITKYTDSRTTDVQTALPFTEMDFKYEKPDTLLMLQHQEVFNDIFGDSYYKPQNVDRGKPYKVESKFSHFKYERLYDDDDGTTLTPIQWGYSAGDNFKPDADAVPKTGDYDSVLTKPLIFYGCLVSSLSSDNRISWLENSNHIALSSYWRPSNSSEPALALIGNVDAPQPFKLIDATANFLSTVNVGSRVINFSQAEPEALVLSVDSNSQLTLDLDIFPTNGQIYFMAVQPNSTINFDNEIDEFDLTDFAGTTNSLFKRFYQTYIEDVFDPRKRIFKLTAHLPNSVLLNYRLNDRFQIGDKVFTINSIDTNLKTGESKLELLNVL